MNRSKAIFIVTILCVASIIVPSIVIFRFFLLNSGWRGLTWGATENQVQDWVLKNNNKATWSKCKISHFGVSCWRLSWKKTEESSFEYIEFQFKDGHLCAVIETNHEKDFDSSYFSDYGTRESGSDLAKKEIREKSVRYMLTDRVFYSSPSQNWKGTKIRYAVEILEKRPIQTQQTQAAQENDSSSEYLKVLLTTGYFSPDFYEEAKIHSEQFPSHRFIAN